MYTCLGYRFIVSKKNGSKYQIGYFSTPLSDPNGECEGDEAFQAFVPADFKLEVGVVYNINWFSYRDKRILTIAES